MKMRTNIITERRLSIHAKRYLLTAWFFCVATGLHAETFTFQSGATVQGRFVGFTGTNTATIKRSTDGVSYTVTVSDLTPASQAQLRSPRAPSRAVAAPSKPWANDPGWLSCQRAIATLRESQAPYERQYEATKKMIAAKMHREDTTKDQEKLNEVAKTKNTLESQIRKYMAQQQKIEASYQLRDAFKKP
jgi:hypothetical protein